MHLTDHGAASLAHLIATRETSCVEVMTAYLERIERVNPQVNAIIALRDEDALLAGARRADAWDGPRGPLHGLPHAVKDLAQVAGLPWTCGSPLFRDRVAVVDDPFVSRLREAGALIVGKTNVPEFGYGSQTYNDVWGVTRNPHDLTLTAGGSSGGAAAALAARLLPVADGSDYMGSLRNPAAFCNVLGLRPSRGRVPGPGFVAQMGETGPMGRSIADVALLLSVLAGPDPAAPLTRTDPLDVADLHPADLRGARVAWVGDLGGRLATEPGLLDVCRGALDPFTALGAEVEDVVPAFDLDRLWDAFLTWRAWAARYLPPGPLKPEAEWERARAAALTVADIDEAMVVRDAWYAAVGDLFRRYDAVLAPSAQVFPFPADVHWPDTVDGRPMDTYHRWMETVLPWSMAGTPVLGMPAGFDPAGRPAGVQLVGPPGADRRVLEIGLAYEQATGWVERVRPLDDRPTRA
ncbi:MULTISPECIES: amidase [unclassified Pseudonocardia]|uniref:amidase n=1 Tax=unclassified Pseudonocardia TaxID=2619320 RepID=UPI000963757C|nr:MULTISPECIES: amidase [unclassified Pseudonocardia]MBN9103296.1 amidase [Pseudonocardia sp.]OJY38395.1 MAG: amidase [Pseudonocardia sp. 73-21]